MKCITCEGDQNLLSLNGSSYYCQGCIDKMDKEWRFAFDRLKTVSSSAMYNEELGVWVEPDGRVYKESSPLNNGRGGIGVRKGGWISFHDNGQGYMVANLAMRGKYVAITRHRVVYATFRGVSYWGKYMVGHFDDNAANNDIENLYGIYGSSKHKKNTDHKKCAYRLLEKYVKGELYDKDGIPIDMGYQLKLD